MQKFYVFLIALSAFSLEFSAIFFSVYGLTKLFVGSTYAVAFMATSIEIAKVVSVSYLYRYWNNIFIFFKIYLFIAIIVMMFITSLGIYGFLNYSFQENLLKISLLQKKIETNENLISEYTKRNELLRNEKYLLDSVYKVQFTLEIENLKFQKENLDKLSDNRISSKIYLSNRVLLEASKNRKSIDTEYSTRVSNIEKKLQSNQLILDSLLEINSKYKIDIINESKELGPIDLISRSFKIPLEITVQFIILLLIFVFDPLAVVLVIGLNSLLKDPQKNDTENKQDTIIDKTIPFGVTNDFVKKSKRGRKRKNELVEKMIVEEKEEKVIEKEENKETEKKIEELSTIKEKLSEYLNNFEKENIDQEEKPTQDLIEKDRKSKLFYQEQDKIFQR